MRKWLGSGDEAEGAYDDERATGGYLPGELYAHAAILSRGTVVPLDGGASGTNNNVALFGAPSSGKSHNVVGPNLMQCEESLVVVDPKGALYEQYGPGLREFGYRVDLIDFRSPKRSTAGWNPFAAATTNELVRAVCERIVYARGANVRDPFWDTCATNLLEALALMARPFETGAPTVRRVMELADMMYEPSRARDALTDEKERDEGRCALDDYVEGRWQPRRLARRARVAKRTYQRAYRQRSEILREAERRGVAVRDDRGRRVAASGREAEFGAVRRKAARLGRVGLAASRRESALRARMLRASPRAAWLWHAIRDSADATFRSIKVECTARLQPLGQPDLLALLCCDGRHQVRFDRLGERRQAVFLTISDVDRSCDFLAKLCVEQAVDELVRHADEKCGGALRVPVRVLLDDFCTMGAFSGVPSWVNSLRSRRIGITLVCQSMAQLRGVYGASLADGIVAACDTCVFVGAANDPDTAEYIGRRVGWAGAAPTHNHCAWSLVRGRVPRLDALYDPRRHPRWPVFQVARDLADRPSWESLPRSVRDAAPECERDVGDRPRGVPGQGGAQRGGE